MKRIWFLLCLLSIHASSAKLPQSRKLQQTVASKNIFLLAGQSNMAGRGGVFNSTAGIPIWDGVVPHACRPNPSILRLDANLNWVKAQEPLHADIDRDKTNGIGPGMAFANEVLKKESSFGVIGLVPCAIGGTNISHWEKGGSLYHQMLKRARASVRSNNNNNGGTIRALLWYQGESDTLIKEDADSYKHKLEKFFQDVRFDLTSPMLPIIQVALASGEGPYTETIREAQLGIDLLNVRTLDDAKGLPLQPDHLHLTTTSQVRLGKMMAHSYLKFQPKPLPAKSSAPLTFSSTTLFCLLGSILTSLLLLNLDTIFFGVKLGK